MSEVEYRRIKLSLAALNLSELERRSVKTCQKSSVAALNFSEMDCRRSEVERRSIKLVRSEVLQRQTCQKSSVTMLKLVRSGVSQH